MIARVLSDAGASLGTPLSTAGIAVFARRRRRAALIGLNAKSTLTAGGTLLAVHHEIHPLKHIATFTAF
jgi:hypothetical protein